MNGEELQDLLSRYVEHRELLGYRHTHGGMLARFVQDYAIKHPGESIKVNDVLEWVTRVQRAPPTQSAILSALRGFLRFVKAVDPATSVPDSYLLPSPHRNPPYILSAEQLQSILHAATTARPRGGLRADAYVAVLGLLASSGLRISEALHLKEADVHSKWSATIRCDLAMPDWRPFARSFAGSPYPGPISPAWPRPSWRSPPNVPIVV